MCVYQEHNGDENFIPVKELGKRCVSICINLSNKKTYLSEYWVGGIRKYLTDENTSATLKFATTALNYPSLKEILIDRVDINSLKSGGDNKLSLAGYINIYIQKKGIWRGETFKEYILE